MGSSHNPGQGERLLSIGRRSISVLLDGRRQSEADVREAVYIRPLGNGRHEVKNFCNEQAYKVGSALGGLTFTPGQTVQLASHTGFPGEVIIGLPPLGRRGASLAPIIRHGRNRGVVIAEEPPAPSCPLPITGKAYLVVDAAGGATDDLYAFLYNDGTYASTLAVKDCSGVLDISTNTKFLKVPGAGHVVVFASVTTAGRDCIVTWDCDANTLAVNSAQATLTGLSIALVGSTVYGNFNPGGSGGACYPITAAIGASGTNDSGFTYSLGTSGSFPKGYMMEEGGNPASPHILFAASTAVVGGFPNSADYGYWLHAPTIASDLDPVEPFRTFNYADVDHPDFVSVPIPGGSGGAIVAGNIFGGRPDRIFRIANGFMSESRLWPDHWTDGSVLGGAIVPAWVPNAAGTELVVTDSVGADYVIVRTTIADLSALDVSCPPPYIVMDAPPVGSISVAFPLD